MNRDEYLKILESDADEIKLDNKDVIEWLDTIADALNIAADNCYELCWGKLNTKEGEYENCIAPCSSVSDSLKKLHIYKGIDTLSKAIGYDLKRKDWSGGDFKYLYYFNYKDIEIFQLEEEKLEGDDK